MLPLAFFAGCSSPVVQNPLMVTEKLAVLLDFLQVNTHMVSGSFAVEGQKTQIFDGVISKKDLRLSLRIDETKYYYSNKILLKSTDEKYYVENADTTLSVQNNLMPYNLFYFSYSENNSDKIFMGNNTIGISFVNKGAMLSFNSNMEVLDGLLSINFADDKIVTSVFTANNSSGKKIVATYNYTKSDYVWDKAPKAAPSDTLNYANYLIGVLSKKYDGYTIHTKDNFNTEATIGDISTEKVKTVTSVDITEENKYYSLTLTYSTKVMIVGISSAITTLTIIYDIDYNVSSIRINATDYILKDPLV